MKTNMKRLKAELFELFITGEFNFEDTFEQIEVYSYHLIIRRYLREKAGAKSHVSIIFKDNRKPPILKTYNNNFYNKRGKVIKCAETYRRRFGSEAWLNLRFYYKTTIVVEVGKKWFIKHIKDLSK